MVPLPGRARMTRVLIALGCLAATASAASAATTIEVCNKGSATVLVASCKVSSSGSDTVEAWLHIDAGACRDVHRELVLNGAFVLPQGAALAAKCADPNYDTTMAQTRQAHREACEADGGADRRGLWHR